MTEATHMTGERDYTITIVQKDGGWIVYEGGEQISRALASEGEATAFARDHVLGVFGRSRPIKFYDVTQLSHTSRFRVFGRLSEDRWSADDHTTVLATPEQRASR
jgi:hypothetical protein